MTPAPIPNQVAKKQQLEDEALMLARDVRVLRQRRRLAEEEAAGAWRAVEQAIQNRQQTELRVEELKLKQRIADATKPELDEVRGGRGGRRPLATAVAHVLPHHLRCIPGAPGWLAG